MRMIHKKTGVEVKVGDKVFERSGHHAFVASVQKPTSPASTGRIYVVMREDDPPLHSQGYYPDVYDCEWVEREDRT